jgi:hypothetical protein
MARRVLVAFVIVLAWATPASAAVRPSPPYSSADYWTFADGVMQYRVVPLAAPRDATLVAVAVAPQPTNPRPGPSLRVELRRRGALRAGELGVRIEPEA